MSDIPQFRYHPRPTETGSARTDPRPCELCGVARGVVYDGPIYGRQADPVCLVCIESGEASLALALAEGRPAEFTDIGWGVPEDVPSSVLEAVGRRTPGFRGWQQEHWLYHCSDACEFLGRVGHEQLALHPDALEMLLHENDEFGWDEQQSREYVEALTPDGEANGYLFRCLHCARTLAYSDMS